MDIIEGLLLQERYRVVKSLGSGSFGKTFLLNDTQSDRPKVLKVLDPEQNFIEEGDRQKVITLFKREAHALQTLDHPGIPKGDPDGYFLYRSPHRFEPYHCLVMEYIAGEDLRTWQEKNPPLSEPLAKQWLTQLLDILIYLHSQNPPVLHRDIKPGNIMLKPDGQLVLVDFGAIREVTETFLEKQKAEQSTTKIYARGYSPPEQMQGFTTALSDLFALGRTLISLLVGQPISKLEFDPQTHQICWQDRVQISALFADLLVSMTALEAQSRPASAVVARQHLLQQTWWRNGLFVGWKTFRPFQGVSAAVVVSIAMWLWGVPWVATELNEQGYNAYADDNWQRAESLFRWALRFNPKKAESHYYLGFFAEEEGNMEMAKERYQQAIASQATFSRAYNDLGRLYLLQNDPRSALPILEMGVQQGFNDPQYTESLQAALHKNLAWAGLATSNLSLAKEQLQKSLTLEDERPAAHCLLAQVAEQEEKMKQAQNSWKLCYQYAQERDRDFPEIQQWQAEAQKFLVASEDLASSID
ncbi:serine/threonine-protein kinase [Roseofilum capinflatum]|uniref:non-specific serine/threonine protein kinase n=1 Tax=Roseofilum capinflatum BLCC-M114 TaxID=3022440 RepID=A0ABT7B3D8_9CYAN|nr:serine/threonine-protein kinase [Roseofilum capinflatum]MDJ1173061.1 protein kinase [Roseofilum capinflatum BLCC-M114]